MRELRLGARMADVTTNDGGLRQYHFISGLPRSGSTLLAAILRQNPRFYAGMTSPVGGLFSNLVAAVSAGSEMSSMVSNQQRRRLSRGLFESYYADHDEELIFDTNRMWSASLAALHELFPNAKVLCCVRNVAWIMDSMEQQFRANAFENTRFFGDAAQRSTVFTRLEALANRNGLVGYAWSALNEALYGPHASKLLIIDYELLSVHPEQVLNLIYDFLGEEPFQHDFENVIYDAPAFDENLGASGLHKVRKKVEYKARRTILPPELFEQYSKLSFWQDLKGSAAKMIVQQPEGNQQKQPEATTQ